MPLSQYFDFGWQQKCVSEPRRVRHFTANLSVGTRLLSALLVMSRAAGTPGICVAKARSQLIICRKISKNSGSAGWGRGRFG